MAERFSRNNILKEPEVDDSSREECEQVAFGFMTAKAGREMVRSKSEGDKKLLHTFQIELDTARRESVHERNLHFPTNTQNPLTVSDTTPILTPPPPDNAPAESAGIILGELEDVLEQHSTSLTLREPQGAESPMSTTSIPFYFAAPTAPRLHLSEVRERVDEAVNRIVPPVDLNAPNSDLPVPPPPPLERSTFNTIVRELIQVSGNNMNPGQLTICLYFCYRLGVRMVTQYMANRLGLGTTLNDLMETCVQFLIEQELLPIVQQQGGWGSYINQWLQPNHQPVVPSTAIGYVGVGMVIGFVLGVYCRALRS